MPEAATTIERSIGFSAEHFVARWTPGQPDVAIAANAVSLLLEPVEAYVVRSARAVLASNRDEETDSLRRYIAQETAHLRGHRAMNAVLLDAYPGLQRIATGAKALTRRLSVKRSEEFNLAFAVGFDALAYSSARWVEKRRSTFFQGAVAEVRDLFFWHFAEEIEHKCVAHDLYRSIGGRKRILVGAVTSALLVLAAFSLAATITMLWHDRRIFRPLTILRVVRWAMSFLVEAVPTAYLGALPSHHPSDLADPLYFVNGNVRR